MIFRQDAAPPLPRAKEWAAAHTKPRCEKVVARYLGDRGVPVYLPVVQNRRTYGARVRISELPLFPGYVFFDHAAVEQREVYESGRVVGILVPPNPGDLHDDLRNLAVALRDPGLRRREELGPPGTPVEVVAGPLLGATGELVRYERRATLIVFVRFLGFAAEVRVDERHVRPTLQSA